MSTEKLHHTSEGRVLWVGIVMALFLAGLVVFYLFVEPERAKTLSLVLVAHTFGGRAAGVGLCIMSGLGYVWNVAYNLYLEILIVCFTYSVFVFSLTNHIHFPWAISFTKNLMTKASKHKDKIEKYGWLGLFLFVMAPLPVTGPVIGSIIGYLLKMNIWRNLSAVFLGTLSAIIVWVVCFNFLEQHLHMIQYFLGAIIAIVLFFHIKTIKGLFL
ncbi:MAG: small multi-drug export protein [Proteobacteria bacterium]|nr:small multi-drug export protein [Pseudomonadota bacterium]